MSHESILLKRLRKFNIQKWWFLVALSVIAIATAGGFVLRYFGSRSLTTSHLLSATPKESERYAATPLNVTLTFDETLDDTRSELGIVLGSTDVTQDTMKIVDKKTMQRAIQVGSGNGMYQVSYHACFLGIKKCEDKNFNFSVDATLQKDYTNLQNQQEVEIEVSRAGLSKPKIIVSPGTQVTWVNKGSADTSILTESSLHPKYYPPQNSWNMPGGDSFQQNFILSGQYNYEATQNDVPKFSGSIIVKNGD